MSRAYRAVLKVNGSSPVASGVHSKHPVVVKGLAESLVNVTPCDAPLTSVFVFPFPFVSP